MPLPRAGSGTPWEWRPTEGEVPCPRPLPTARGGRSGVRADQDAHQRGGAGWCGRLEEAQQDTLRRWAAGWHSSGGWWSRGDLGWQQGSLKNFGAPVARSGHQAGTGLAASAGQGETPCPVRWSWEGDLTGVSSAGSTGAPRARSRGPCQAALTLSPAAGHAAAL